MAKFILAIPRNVVFNNIKNLIQEEIFKLSYEI